MKKKSVKLLAVLAVSLFAAQVASAAAVDVLVNKLASKGIITRGEAQQIIVESSEEERAIANSGKNPMVPMWVQKLTLTGDVRIRSQFDWSEKEETRIRERLRLRIGIETMASDKVKMGFGIASGTTGANGNDEAPTSTNYTFSGFNKVPVFIDYAFIQYAAADWIKISAGKLKNKTQVWSASDLLWDTDINPDGLAVNLKSKIGKVGIFGNAGAYVLNEQRPSSANHAMPAAYIAQPGVDFKIGQVSVKAAVAYQSFGFKHAASLGSNKTGDYLGVAPYADYNVINPSLEVKFGNVFSKALSVFGDYAYNINDNDGNIAHDDRTGFLYGVSFGDAKIEKFGSWNVKGMYRYLEAAVVPLGLGDSDAYGGKAGKGYEVTVAFGLTKNMSFNIDYYNMGRMHDNKAGQSLLQLDFNYKI
jgi:hypothetical protein